MPLALIPILVMMLFALPARADAASWSSPTTITASGAVQLDLAIGADGTAAVAYPDARGVQVAVRRAGHGWSSPRLVSGGRFTTTRPSVSVTGSGEVVVAWVQSGSTITHPSPTSGPLTIRAAIRSSRGSWGSPRQIGTSAHFIDAGVDAAANAHGDAVIVWRGVQCLSHGRRTDAVQSSYLARGGARLRGRGPAGRRARHRLAPAERRCIGDPADLRRPDARLRPRHRRRQVGAAHLGSAG